MRGVRGPYNQNTLYTCMAFSEKVCIIEKQPLELPHPTPAEESDQGVFLGGITV